MVTTDATTIFLALEPDEATWQLVASCKDRVRQLVGDQLYLDDPPHVTLYLASFGDVGEALSAIASVAQELSVPRASLAGWHAFEADALTGLNTLVLDFDEASKRKLQSLQQSVLESVAGLRDVAASAERFAPRLKSLAVEQRRAARDTGFPYVGEGWHPHLTIASIRPEDWPAATRELLRRRPHHAVEFSHLVVYELVDGRPCELARHPLATAGDKPQVGPATSSVSGEATAAASELGSLKEELTAAIWRVVDDCPWILSATLTGSFLTDQSLASISDIDLVLIVDALNQDRFHGLQADFQAQLSPPLASRGLSLLINSTLGPRKLNDDATAVLHMMLYSREGHHMHAIKSPFTCLDWQRSSTFRKASLEAVYPVFALQPHHFMSARRGIRDYLHDFERGVVSYRELECTEVGYREKPCEEPMDLRDRHEYAYHVMRFLMQNLLKLVRRRNAAPDGELLLREFFAVFPSGQSVYAPLYLELQRRKKNRDFMQPLAELQAKLRQFVLDFESQFRVVFFESATRHIVFRHAETPLNGGAGDERRFVGRVNPAVYAPTAESLASLIEAAADASIEAAYSSPLTRCRQSIDALAQHLALPEPQADPRLLEIDYGRCDGLTVAEARDSFPQLFAAWQRGEDARFPDGENSDDVQLRLSSFADEVWGGAAGNTIICTHCIVLRTLVGEAMGVPGHQRHRLRIPHLAPIAVVQTKKFGRFIDLEETVERQIFGDFLIAE
jgi:broad specificity phosphatase PhoE/2'-5' RNA ligase